MSHVSPFLWRWRWRRSQESIAEGAAKGSADSSATGKPWWAGMEEMFHAE